MDASKTGRFISELRREKNLTQAQLADALFVSDKAISRWETGKGFPDINNLEAIAKALDVSASELLKGERFGEEITEKDVEELTEGSFAIFKGAIKRAGMLNLLIGLLVSLVLITFVIVQLIAPMHIEGAGNALSMETLSDGRIVALLGEDVAGCYVEDLVEPDRDKSEFNSDDVSKLISCYDTLWYRWFVEKQQKFVVIGDESEIDRIYYYPGVSEERVDAQGNIRRSLGFNELIYKSGDAGADNHDGIMTLNRLVYNHWLVIGAGMGVLGILVYILFRKKRVGSIIFKVALLPIAFSLSIFLSLIGHRHQVYDAPHYFLGIVLLTILLYALFLAIRYRRIKALRSK